MSIWARISPADGIMYISDISVAFAPLFDASIPKKPTARVIPLGSPVAICIEKPALFMTIPPISIMTICPYLLYLAYSVTDATFDDKSRLAFILFAFIERMFQRKPVCNTVHRAWGYPIKHFRPG